MLWQPYLPYNAIICRYNEIATKGRNRASFEEALVHSVRHCLAPLGKLDVVNERGRLFFLPKNKAVFTAEDIQLMRDVIPTVPGVSSISPGFYTEPTLEAIEAIVNQYYPVVYETFSALPENIARTYAMRARRADKDFPMTAEQIERYFAIRLLEPHPELKLDLKNANLLVEVEIRYHQAFVSFERIAGPGGLPAGTSGRVLALLSGGFDSPVACFQMMRRGCGVDYVTFHSEPYTPPAYVDKLIAISRKLNEYQYRGRLAVVNLLPAQLEIRDKCHSRFRTLLYRRFMMRIANKLAPYFECRALVTGDNLGQVASQTLDNLAVIENASELMVLRPLLTFDKLDSIAIAEKIGTWTLCAEQIPDSCTVFAPDDPTLHARLSSMDYEEKLLDVDKLVQECLDSTVVVIPDTGTRHPFLKKE